ncbi:hypothetical protein [Pandoraea anhela]|uniref:hypothetical protein n=1 Tax=Pandoraea anhela TaxID=2508295 RepID=UPI001FE81427|nr:hypothetical protein [Pandoraea anhela]
MFENISFSFIECGMPTDFQPESSNPGCETPLGSAFPRNFHGVAPRLIFTRAEAGTGIGGDVPLVCGVAVPATANMQANAMLVHVHANECRLLIFSS